MLTPAPMTPAAPAEAAAIVALRDELATWMVGAGIAQWLPGEYPVAVVAAEVERGEWFVWRADDALVGAVRIIWRDPEFWGVDDADAGYIHGLMISPRHRGGALGRRILAFCAEHTLAHGHTRQRLDTAAGNHTLRTYYAAQGFRELREAPLPPQYHGTDRIVLMEKALLPA